jgi:hypothetical protein
MGKFGWSYPPGCSGPPEDREPSPVSEAIYSAIDDAGYSDEAVEGSRLWDEFESFVHSLDLNQEQWTKLKQAIKDNL